MKDCNIFLWTVIGLLSRKPVPEILHRQKKILGLQSSRLNFNSSAESLQLRGRMIAPRADAAPNSRKYSRLVLSQDTYPVFLFYSHFPEAKGQGDPPLP